jgi:uncharacterized protein
MEEFVTAYGSFLAVLIVFVGSVVQGSVGIGLGFVAVPLLVLINPDFVPGPLLLSALVLTLLIAIREHHSIESKNLSWAVFGRTVGTLAGIFLITVIPISKISLLFAGMIILAVIISLMGLRLKLNKKNLFGTGVLSGIMGTTAAIGGVPLAIIYQDFKGPRLRGTLSGIFTFGTILSIIALAVVGKFGLKEFQLGVVLIPGILLGYFISIKTAKYLDQGLIRPIVLLIASFAALGIILRFLV